MIIKLIVLLVILSIFSCNESIENYPKLIVGKWTHDNSKYDFSNTELDTFEYTLDGNLFEIPYEKGAINKKQVATWKLTQDTLVTFWNDGAKNISIIKKLNKWELVEKSKNESDYWYFKRVN